MHILPECIAGIKHKWLKKDHKKTPIDVKFLDNEENNLLSYACPSKAVRSFF